ncbi:hypothetical protein, partial [Salsuginibacillus halophilus]|uniref:hypothetical protein n=1 Tax=Salsuginibacillus halophilus TaxID=517424 RepID=UPI001C625E02
LALAIRFTPFIIVVFHVTMCQCAVSTIYTNFSESWKMELPRPELERGSPKLEQPPSQNEANLPAFTPGLSAGSPPYNQGD